MLRLVSWLPLPVIAVLGYVLGTGMFYVVKSRRNIALRNVAVCFPDMNSAQRQQTVKRCFQLIGTSYLYVGVHWWASYERLDRLLTYEGKAHYDKAIADGSNIILLAPHAIGLEVAGLMLSRERSMMSMYQEARRKPLLNEMVKNGRERFGGLLIERRAPLRSLLKLIRAGKPFYYLPDQDARAEGVFVPFFGTQASTFPVLSKFAKIGNAVVIPCYTHILPRGRGWRVIIGEPLANFPGKNEHEDALRMNQAIEEMIRREPAQYYWLHKRFKTRPDGAKDFYGDN